MKRVLIIIGSAVAIAFVGCGDGDGHRSTLDANGVFDMSEQTVTQMLGAIQTECADEITAGGFGTLTVQQCRDVCDCGVRAVADLENRTQAPELTTACDNACDPNFQPTSDLRVEDIEDDADDEPEFDRFFLAYIIKCDEVANRQIRPGRDFVKECVDTCNCLSDTMEKYISESSDDNIRASCDDACAAAHASPLESGDGNAMVSSL